MNNSLRVRFRLRPCLSLSTLSLAPSSSFVDLVDNFLRTKILLARYPAGSSLSRRSRSDLKPLRILSILSNVWSVARDPGSRIATNDAPPPLVRPLPVSTLARDSLLRSRSRAIALMTRLRCRQYPGELTGHRPRSVLTAVQSEHLDRHLVTVIAPMVMDAARARRTLAVVPSRDLLVDAVSQSFAGVYQLQLSA